MCYLMGWRVKMRLYSRRNANNESAVCHQCSILSILSSVLNTLFSKSSSYHSLCAMYWHDERFWQAKRWGQGCCPAGNGNSNNQCTNDLACKNKNCVCFVSKVSGKCPFYLSNNRNPIWSWEDDYESWRLKNYKKICLSCVSALKICHCNVINSAICRLKVC